MTSSPAFVQLSSFEYRAARHDGGLETGIISAKTEVDALRLLEARGLLAADLRRRPQRHAASLLLGFGGRAMPVADLALGLRVLADFLDSGLPIARALGALEEMAPSSWQAVLPVIRAAIRDGRSLASALSEAPVRFPPLIVGLIRAGESGIGLAVATRRAAVIMEEASTARAAIRAALAYPVVLLVAGTVSLCLLVGVVIPRFVRLLADLGEALPSSTRALLAVSSGVRAAALPGSIALVVAWGLWRAWTSTEGGEREWHGILRSVPVLGQIRLTTNSSRIGSALGALLETGVAIAPAMSIAAKASDDAMLTAKWLAAREAVIRGERLSTALRTGHAATPTAIRLVRAGEESGHLATMLAHASRLDREEALRRTQSAVRFLEPAFILLFGALVAFVAAALLQALYSIRPTS
jgi:type II secretory pathway component PulF